MKKTIYLMRHGQTLFNVQKKIQGWCDSTLTPLGRAQARFAKRYFEERGIDLKAAYCSTQERACDTLEIMTDLPYTRLKGLKEMNFGHYEGKDECLNPPLAEYDTFFAKYAQGEKGEEAIERICSTMEWIAQNEDADPILVVLHGAILARFYRAWEQEALVKKKERFHNGCILKYEYEDGIFRFVEIYNPDYQGEAR